MIGARYLTLCNWRTDWVRHRNYATSPMITPTTEYLSSYEGHNSNHHNLHTFLEYAKRIHLDPSSTCYVGTHYEYTVKTALEHLGMTLKRVGGRDDRGTDLFGTWSPPSALQALKILVQCKAKAGKLTPAYARELEGSFIGAPAGWREPGTLGLLVSKQPVTKGVREALLRSQWSMGYAQCSANGKLLQMIWNKKAEKEGLDGIHIGVRYTGGDIHEREVVLTWKNEVIC
ncbi:BgTH12-04068 [Blumeria graminis f. sp. triticale]|uniref:Bgt-980 n=3 Tax=Blumeria graminis TaxID=34373 RepID=A0A061HFB6_BLUGR|nr:hypothetical protein BGT96224_980 [Blumeria graminis f. sp. tritici 96224]CAD6499963.1 BgTH12-04068 [Blumeria graminis f. sp. triticale]VCU40138.1 Bgt-980 [Blumeria graminis f. sp. tritici]